MHLLTDGQHIMALTTTQLLALMQLPGVGKKTVLKIREKVNGVIDDRSLIDVLLAAKVLKKTPAGKIPFEMADLNDAIRQAEDLLEATNRQNMVTLSYDEPDFPETLRQAVDDEGRWDPALVIFCQGNLELLKRPGIAVIGTRRVNPTAVTAGKVLSSGFAARGLVVVSGLALGSDTAAHEGALVGAPGATIAVLGNGLDTIYPKENQGLAQRIVDEGGLLLTEYPLGTKANRFTLVARDRLQAALSRATVVLQSSINGGCYHAARATVALKRPLYAVRYSDPVFDASQETAGNRDLMATYGAQPIGGYKTKTEMNSALDALVTALT